MWALTKRTVVENRRNILITLGVMFGMILLVSVLFTKMFEHDYDWRGEERGAILWLVYAWISAIVMQITGSLTFSCMSTKSKRIANLMLPARQSEKFFGNCLIYVVGGNLALILSLILADSLSAMIFGFAPGWYYLPQNLDFSEIIAEMPYACNFIAICVLGLLFFYLMGQSIYVLGSAWWPRKSFLKTFVAIMALQIIIPIITPWGLLAHSASDLIKWIDNCQIPSSYAIAAAWSILMLAYAVLAGVYALAWHRYKRLEIVKRFL